MAEDGHVTPLSDHLRRQLINDVIDDMSSRGLRTIAIAFRDFVSGRTLLTVYRLLKFELTLQY